MPLFSFYTSWKHQKTSGIGRIERDQWHKMDWWEYDVQLQQIEKMIFHFIQGCSCLWVFREPPVFWCFQGVQKETSGIKWLDANTMFNCSILTRWFIIVIRVPVPGGVLQKKIFWIISQNSQETLLKIKFCNIFKDISMSASTSFPSVGKSLFK